MSSYQLPGNQSAPNENGSNVAYLDQALWKTFHDAAGIEDFSAAWLTLQCSILAGVDCGVLVLGAPGKGPYSPVASWPDSTACSQILADTAESALAQQRGVINRPKHQNEAATVPGSYQAAYPVVVDDQLCGVVAVEMPLHGGIEPRVVMRQLEWGCGWLEAVLRRTREAGASVLSSDLSAVLELGALGLEPAGFRETAIAVVTELAIRTHCDRVALGFRKGKHIRVLALSHSAEFGKQSNLTRAIGASMDEAIDQYGHIVFPAVNDASGLVMRAHAELAENSSTGAICTLPLSQADEIIGALTFERNSANPFDPRTVSLLEQMAVLLGPILDNKRRNDRWLISKIWVSFRSQVAKLIGAGHFTAKLVALLLVAVILFFSYVEDDYRISADAVLEGSIQRSTVAPIAGYLSKAHARAGDLVAEGDLLFTIDDRDLRLEYLKWSSQKEQIQRKLRDALAQRERSEVSILSAQLEQAEAQLSLINEQIERTRVTAPFAGVIVAGDLNDRLGAPVERGEVMMVLAPIDSYRVILSVDERDINDIQKDQVGNLKLAAVPQEELPLRVVKITPVSEAMAGRNTFRVEAMLAEAQSNSFLRPGMQGSARIAVDHRKLAWIWTHDLVNWLRLWFWSRWP